MAVGGDLRPQPWGADEKQGDDARDGQAPAPPGDPAYPDDHHAHETEADCQRDVAGVYDEHTQNDDFNGDIAYNFLVCRHGKIYQGRGYERGEANHAGTVDGLGRNAGFYSICALMRSNHTATE